MSIATRYAPSRQPDGHCSPSKGEVTLEGGLPAPEHIGPLASDHLAHELAIVGRPLHDPPDRHAVPCERLDGVVGLLAPEITLVLQPSAEVSSFGLAS